MSRRPQGRGAGLALAVAAAAVLGACESATRVRLPTAAVGDVAEGKRAIAGYGCGSCHTIPGIRGADSFVGPPLNAYGRRSFVAGTMPNSAENLARWIEDPPAVRPGTAMPDLGVSQADARDIAAYLHSLR